MGMKTCCMNVVELQEWMDVAKLLVYTVVSKGGVLLIPVISNSFTFVLRIIDYTIHLQIILHELPNYFNFFIKIDLRLPTRKVVSRLQLAHLI